MIKHTQTIRQQQLANCLSVFGHFWGLELKEVWYYCSAHRLAHLFIIKINSHSHVKRKQPQIFFLHCSCSVTMINIIKKFLWRKIHELNTLIGCSDDSESQAQNKHLVKIACYRITTCGCFRSFVKSCIQNFRFFRN